MSTLVEALDEQRNLRFTVPKLVSNYPVPGCPFESWFSHLRPFSHPTNLLSTVLLAE